MSNVRGPSLGAAETREYRSRVNRAIRRELKTQDAGDCKGGRTRRRNGVSTMQREARAYTGREFPHCESVTEVFGFRRALERYAQPASGLGIRSERRNEPCNQAHAINTLCDRRRGAYFHPQGYRTAENSCTPSA